MARLTKKDLEKLPECVYIPCVYSFRGDPVDKGYLFKTVDGTFLKHNCREYEGLGVGGVRGCKYSWKIYSGSIDYSSCLTVLEINRNLGEL